MNQIEINVPYIAELDGKAIPTQGITIKLPPDSVIKLNNDSKGNTSVIINELVVYNPSSDLPYDTNKSGFLSGVPLDTNMDSVSIVAPNLTGEVV